MSKPREFPHYIDGANRSGGERAPPVHTRTYRCAMCGETLSSPSQNYTCPVGGRGFIPLHLLPRLP